MRVIEKKSVKVFGGEDQEEEEGDKSAVGHVIDSPATSSCYADHMITCGCGWGLRHTLPISSASSSCIFLVPPNLPHRLHISLTGIMAKVCIVGGLPSIISPQSFHPA